MRIGHGYRNQRLEFLDDPRVVELDLPIRFGMNEREGCHDLQARTKKVGPAGPSAPANQITRLRGVSANHQWLALSH